MTLSSENKKIHLIGAGGNARAVYGLLRSIGFVVEGFYDEKYFPNEKIGESIAKGKLDQIKNDDLLVLTSGDNSLREKQFNQYSTLILAKNIVHTSSIIFEEAVLGKSNLVFARVVINSFANIGHNNILNTGCIIEHEVEIGSHNHISVNAVLAGRVKVGNRCFVGAGAIVKDGITIADDCIIGAGAVVIDDLKESGTYVGVPAKKIK